MSRAVVIFLPERVKWSDGEEIDGAARISARMWRGPEEDDEEGEEAVEEEEEKKREEEDQNKNGREMETGEAK